MTSFIVVDVVAAVIINDGKFLGVKRSAIAKNNPSKWEFPGGKVEKNESIHQAIIREVKEEIGLDVIPKELIHVYTQPHESFQYHIHYVLCDVKELKKLNLFEHQDFAWFTTKNFDGSLWLPGDDELVRKLGLRNL